VKVNGALDSRWTNSPPGGSCVGKMAYHSYLPGTSGAETAIEALHHPSGPIGPSGAEAAGGDIETVLPPRSQPAVTHLTATLTVKGCPGA